MYSGSVPERPQLAGDTPGRGAIQPYPGHEAGVLAEVRLHDAYPRRYIFGDYPCEKIIKDPAALRTTSFEDWLIAKVRVGAHRGYEQDGTYGAVKAWKRMPRTSTSF